MTFEGLNSFVVFVFDLSLVIIHFINDLWKAYDLVTIEILFLIFVVSGFLGYRNALIKFGVKLRLHTGQASTFVTSAILYFDTVRQF